jgi:hypothetical protein
MIADNINTNQPAAQSNARGGIVRQVAVILATVITICVNILANALPINGQNTGDISDSFPVYFVPAGYVFSIWGVIYIGLIAYSIFQALPSQRSNQTLVAIAPWYLLSAAANTAWIFCWHYNQFGLSLAVMLVLLASLIMIYRRLNSDVQPASRAELWAVRVPFSVYLGWICVATIANATNVIYLTGWNAMGISEPMWAAIMLVVATVLGLAFSIVRNDIGLVLVFVWAFIGIAVKHSATPVVAVTAWVGALLLVVSLVVGAVRRRNAKAV